MNTKKYLFIVESPIKVNTIRKFLPSNYTVVASMGHVRQLIPKPNAFKLKDGQIQFNWVTNDLKMKNLLIAAKQVDKIILACDNDREGAGIAFHLLSIFRENGINIPYERVCFNEITKTAIENALKNPTTLNDNLVNAYFSRVVFDHAIGFSLSPMLWIALKPFGHKQSAGRVQSVALRLIAEREVSRLQFNSHKYYSIEGNFSINTKKLICNLKKTKINCGNINSLTENEMNQIYDLIEKSNKDYKVINILSDIKNISPQAPFITSTLQQEASIALNMRVNEIMQAAQKLYELGLITYHRSDSTYMSEEAIKNIREYIHKNHENYLSEKVNIYDKKSKNAQEAHECIRPTNISISTHNEITQDQQDLYNLIRYRALESQMKPAQYEYLNNIIENDQKITWEIKESHCIFDSYNIYYNKEKNIRLNLKIDDVAELSNIIKSEHETKPPKRYTEASLIKQLEVDGIGRPSTMANIFETLKTREYITYKGRSIDITFKGLCVSAFLTLFFANYVNYSFTFEMENKLDDIVNGINFIPTLEKILEHLDNETSQIKKIIKTTNENITINPALYNEKTNLSFDNIYNLNDILRKMSPYILVKKCNKCQNGTLYLTYTYHFYGTCDNCGDTNNLQRECHSITENINIINTGKFRYIDIENQKYYLPNCIDHNISEQTIEELCKLPYTFTYKDKKFIVGKTFRNFFIKNELNQYFNFDDTVSLHHSLNFDEKTCDKKELLDFICEGKLNKYVSKRKYDNNKEISVEDAKKQKETTNKETLKTKKTKIDKETTTKTKIDKETTTKTKIDKETTTKLKLNKKTTIEKPKSIK